MAAQSPTFEELQRTVRAARGLAPVYILHGEEGYYVDELVHDFENVLPETDRDFNQYVFYAPQIEMEKVMETCWRVPFMADRQMVILKECQAVNANIINRLHLYVAKPNTLTTLVICFRGDKAKGKDLLAAARKTGAVVFEGPKVTEYNAPGLIAAYLKAKKLNADPKAVTMIFDHVGTDLARLHNEIDKLATILPAGAMVTPEVIERNIGVSKDFNTFELVDAVARADVKAVFRIAEYFRANPKASANVLNTAMLFSLFSDVLVAQFSADKTERGLMGALGLKSPYPLKRIRTAMGNYNAWRVIEIIDALRRFDAMSKGQGSRMNEHDLFRDLLFHILTAPGRLPV